MAHFETMNRFQHTDTVLATDFPSPPPPQFICFGFYKPKNQSSNENLLRRL